MRAKAPRFKVGQMARTVRYVPGIPVGISAEQMVDVHEVFTSRPPRYKVSYCGGSRLWVDEDALEALGSPANA